jgi:serine/threonine-protein kinase
MESLPDIADFEVLSCLGYGARSTIYAVSEKRTGQLYALKRVLRRSADDDRFLEQAEQEYAISSQFDHPVLRKSHRLIKRRKLLKVAELYLLMDLFDGTSLDAHRPSNLSTLLRIFTQVAQGLGAMHKLGYVHADIKPNNILVNDQVQVKLIDFGQSCPIGTVKTRIQGTPDYIAPEQVGRGPLTPATDVFNFGATLYWCVTDRHIPTLIPKKKNTLAAVDARELIAPADLNPAVPQPLSRLIMDCVQNRPSQRPRDMADVLSRLELALSVTRANAAPLASTPPSGNNSLVSAIPDSKDDSTDTIVQS